MRNAWQGRRVLVMGLGLHGGGLAAVRHLVSLGAEVTVTDMKTAEQLAPSLEQLKGLRVRYVLGEHRTQDFEAADVVLKNPGVRRTNPYLAKAKALTSDIALFLEACPSPILAVTGTKGKSTTVSALHHLLLGPKPGARLGGNITISPLTFLPELKASDPVVLELSSWQLGDLPEALPFAPQVSGITCMLWDHMNSYASFEDYVHDKERIFRTQGPNQWTVVNADDAYAERFGRATLARVLGLSLAAPDAALRSKLPRAEGWLWADAQGALYEREGRVQRLWSGPLAQPGRPFTQNLLFAAAQALAFGLTPELVAERALSFAGVEHRLELFHRSGGVEFINDTAATIPEAAVEALRSFQGRRVHLITGGTDKNIRLEAWRELGWVPHHVILLPGDATEKLKPLYRDLGWTWEGPVTSMAEAVGLALAATQAGDVVLLSPGAASFGLFQHEFDRGRQFKDEVRRQAP